MRGSEKITTCHLDRTVLIYIRQLSMAQVRESTESTARQYALADEAVLLGWPRSGLAQRGWLYRRSWPGIRQQCGRIPASIHHVPGPSMLE